ncbi:1-acyl-sn-glycerol-3-phosphate acyltransferase PLS1-like [Juglans microcarpa x Juglans regia]|uniref:1-acyl-sn-glycerol-3-phosphate acyltransferase PLS1-like n=1 Tax=Juglans microcarpa x Juglans regia TaxID=2249226 RepID=UPI001B7E0A61|nr:1-acyl-sn-glycerol-3-phosphate acyltransferase PLS1-like [Juglans microcarpa x Juglans regia]
MEATKTASCLPFGIAFICTGILVNLIQATCFLIVRPLSKTLFRRINGAVTEILWLHVIWLMDWWSGLKVQLYTDHMDTYRLMGKEHAILMPNHMCDADILMVWLLAQRFGCLRSALMVVKKSSKYLPIYGWASWFFEFIFLDRSWEKDEHYLKSSLEGLKDFPRPFWLTMFVEGTRMTEDKLLAAQEFAASRGLPVPRNVLVPRTKGFVAAVKQMRYIVPAVYDVTFAVSKGHPLPSLLRIFERQPSEVKIYIKRYSMKELPESDGDIAQWCKDRFVEKDAMLEEFRAEGTFGGKEIPDGGRSLQSLLVYITCLCLCCVGIYKFNQAYSLSSTWKGNAILAGGLAMVVVVGNIFVEYTKLPKRALIAAAAKANMN